MVKQFSDPPAKVQDGVRSLVVKQFSDKEQTDGSIPSVPT